MAFTDVSDESIADRYVLAELSLGRKQGQWVPYEAGVWYYHFYKYSLNQTYGYKKGFLLGYKESGTDNLGIKYNPIDINSCYVDGEEYTEASSLANMIATNKRWWYAPDEVRFYIHIDGFDPPHAHIVVVGITWPIANKAKNINSMYYEPRLMGSVTIEKSKDPLEFGVIRHTTSGLQMHNEDGFFDEIKESVVTYQPVYMKYGVDLLDGTIMAYANYQDVGRRHIENYGLTWKQFNISLVDGRKILSRKIPTNVYNQTAYPNLSDKNIGKSIPLVWGIVKNVPCICTDEEASPSNFNFKCANVSDHGSGIRAITTAYVNGVEETIQSTDLTNGEFTIANTDYAPGQKVTADITGFDFAADDDNPLDIIEDILDTYQSIAYNATNFDTAEWATAKALAYDVGIFIDKPTEISKIIEKIGVSNFGNFIDKDDGKYSFRIFDRQAASTRTITVSEIFGEPNISWAGSRFLTKVKVGYAQDYSEKQFAWYEDDTAESDVHAENKKYQEKEPETYLVNAADAQSLAEDYIDLMKSIRGVVNVTVGTKHMDLEIMDIITITLDRRQSAWFGELRCQVIGLRKNLMSGKVDITGLVLD